MQQRNCRRSMASIGVLMALLTAAHTAVSAESPRRAWVSNRRQYRSTLWHIRGGSSSVPPDANQMHRMPQNRAADPYPQSNGLADPSLYQHPSSPNTDASYTQQQYAPSDDSNYTPPYGERMVDPIHETVQDRLDAWKEKQLQNMEHYQRVPIDDKGRTKLVLSISKSSRVLVFFVFTWRTLHLYEQVVGNDRTRGSTSSSILSANPFGPKAILALPVFLLFLADILGTILSLTSISSFTKKRLKAILNLNKFAEIIVLFYSIVRLTVWPSQYVTKEIYVGRVLHAFLLLLQVQAYTRLSWDETAAPSVTTYREMSMAESTHQPTPEESQPAPYGAQGYNRST